MQLPTCFNSAGSTAGKHSTRNTLPYSQQRNLVDTGPCMRVCVQEVPKKHQGIHIARRVPMRAQMYGGHGGGPAVDPFSRFSGV